MYICMYIYMCTSHPIRRLQAHSTLLSKQLPPGTIPGLIKGWRRHCPLDDIAITDIVWCMA